jgi:hypothetical protein
LIFSGCTVSAYISPPCGNSDSSSSRSCAVRLSSPDVDVFTMAAAATMAEWIGAEAFMHQPHIDAEGVATKDLNALANQLLDHIAEKGLENVLCVDRVHKHYDLSENEVVVQRLELVPSITIHLQPQADISPEDLLPSGWVVCPLTGEWRVVLYTDLRNLPAKIKADLVAGYQLVEAAASTLSELKACTADGQLGVSLRLMEILNAPVTACFRETTYADRSQTLALGDAFDATETNITITGWSCTWDRSSGVITRACTKTCHSSWSGDTYSHSYSTHYSSGEGGGGGGGGGN